MTKIRIWLIAIVLLTACGSKPVLKPGSSLKLASFTENSVTVSLTLEADSAGQAFVAATFTPSDPTFHLYSIEIPRDGLNGLGRPTLVEPAPGAKMQAAGPLTASAEAKDADIDGLPIYPAGAVTLRLPVTLPAGSGWMDDSLSVTYMACGEGICMPPVIGKIIAVRIPRAEAISNP